MRKAMWALMVGCAASASGAIPAAAQDYPFCIKGCDFGAGRGDCSFFQLSAMPGERVRPRRLLRGKSLFHGQGGIAA
jgi:hypothetical protein